MSIIGFLKEFFESVVINLDLYKSYQQSLLTRKTRLYYTEFLFYIKAIQNIVCSTTMTICAVIMICLNERPSWTCQGLVIANFVLLRTQSVMIPLISVLRHAMASKAMSSKMIQKKIWSICRPK